MTVADGAGAQPGDVLWRPTEDVIEASALRAFSTFAGRGPGADYGALWRWSVEDPAEFWAAVWSFYDLGSLDGVEQVIGEQPMPRTRWFAGATTNFAGYLLTRGRDDDPCIISASEVSGPTTWTWAKVRQQAASFAQTLRDHGIGEGDVVVGYLPDVPEAVVAFFGAALVGATWAAVGQDYASAAAVERLGQLRPRALIGADGYHHGGRVLDRRAELCALADALRDTLILTVLVDNVSAGELDREAVQWADAISSPAPLVATEVAFDHPLWVLFTSGTTGRPKGLIHGHGGILLETLKQLGLHWNLTETDRVFWYTSPSWVMWNIRASALALGASMVCYDGAPSAGDPWRLWQLVAETGATFFGTSPGFLGQSRAAGPRPEGLDLSGVRAMGVTGSPLPADLHGWTSAQVPGRPVYSISGGTDVAGVFCGGAPWLPVYAGELSAPALGVAVQTWDDRGHPVRERVGELVVTRPMPSMPIGMWDDPGERRYESAYFDTFPGIWRHGDWATITARGSVVIHGRSDATLNRQGVRFGSADLCSVVDPMPEVTESLVVGLELDDGGYWMPMFLELGTGHELTDELADRIRSAIRQLGSPRYVPDDLLAVRAIPHTRTGKKLEVPIKRALLGTPVEEAVSLAAVDDADAFSALVETARQALEQRQKEKSTS